MRSKSREIQKILEHLEEASVIRSTGDVVSLDESWRSVLPQVIAVEVKVSNWQSAVQQAARNQLFVHKSFVALPETIALRVRQDPLVQKMGVGLLAITEGNEVYLVRRARSSLPKIWAYYYGLAVAAGHQLG
jgi:hypothetical protein